MKPLKMIERSPGFLNPKAMGAEPFDYVRELHEILWRFVRVEYPEASGSLGDWLPTALATAEARKELSKEGIAMNQADVEEVLEQTEYLIERAINIVSGPPYSKYLGTNFCKLSVEGDRANLCWLECEDGYSEECSFPAKLLLGNKKGPAA